MRIFIAWFLLIIATFQWFGSYFSFRLRRDIIVEYQMNFLESSMSEIIENETGLMLSLKTTSPEYIEIMGYDSKFIVTQFVDGKDVHFIVDDSHKKILHVEQKTQNSNDNHNRDAIVFKLVLSDFIKQQPVSLPPITSTDTRFGWFSPEVMPTCCYPIPTPPPEVV